MKSNLATCVKAEFGIDLEVSQVSTGSDEISSKRTDAFFLCRSLLIREKIANYAEQFEGLYAMLRGLSVAFGIGAVYLAGWGCSGCASQCLGLTGLTLALLGGFGVLAKSLLVLKHGSFPRRVSADLWLLLFLLTAAFGLGMRLGMTTPGPAGHLAVMWGSALAALVASTRCYSGYRAFTMQFAKAVWRDFLSFKSQPPDQSKKSNGISSNS